ncbi:hypothetical protein KUTeg_014118 [Tegillarca granosa]|uniref:Protein stoned-B n=1 Tax=Tegillarca granosa TaxID=220873 RepID=A0ABQ9EVP7_TEGGR|nr:hypothetical protein KUTeg_014118 [Tegillarca granosa]
MSLGSYDESSNLVVDVTSPVSTDNDKDENVFDKFPTDQQQSDEHSLDTPKKKGFGFKKKRAKSPLRSPLKSPLKLPHFKHHKSSKSQPKSPTNDLSAEELKEIEKRISEKKSEEWQAFQQMQDRIKQTVSKTQTSLTKLSSADDNTDSNVESKFKEKQKTFSESSWQNSFDDTSSLIPSRDCDAKKKTSKIDHKEKSEIDLLDLSPNLPHLHVTPVPSPRGTPRPPANSLRTSMENITSEEGGPTNFQETEDVDLLGLSCDTENANVTTSQVENYNVIVNQDLLGLDNLVMEPQDGSSVYSSSMDGSDVMFGNMCSQSSSQRSTPLGFDMWGEDDQTVPVGTIDSEFVSNMVDEFLQLDTMKEAMSSTKFNPFQTIDHTMDETLDSLDPFSPKPVFNPENESVNVEGNYSSKKNFFDSFKEEDDDEPNELSSSQHVYDNLGFGNSDQKKNTQETDLLNRGGVEADLLTNSADRIDTGLITTTADHIDVVTESNVVQTAPDPSKNPFLTATGDTSAAANVDTSSNLFDDNFFETKSKNVSGSASNAFGGDVWGVSDDTMTSGTGATKSEPKNIQTEIELGGNNFEIRDSSKTIDENDHEKDDEETALMLEIKPLTEVKSDTFQLPPALAPPPKTSKSPQPTRENPFDKESPLEEDFANFEDFEEDKEIADIRPSASTSISTDRSTPESFHEEDLEPLEPFIKKTGKNSWKLMLRQPSKKKLTANRYWKNVIVKLVQQEDGPVLKLYYDEEGDESFQELPLQPCYSLSGIELQHYDQYGKIHTIKIQYVFYKERVGIRPDRITPSFVKKPKPTMILDHSPQLSELLKFGCLDKEEMQSFVVEVEDALMKIEAHREKTLTYTKEEVTAEVWDEFKAELDKHGRIITQKTRTRIFFLAFITGMPTCELGLNDRRRRGKEVVGRHDIIPIKTEEWIRLEDVEFHCCVDLNTFQNTNNIRFHPLDACQFELVRYRVRLRENKELPLQIKVQQSLKERRFEIRCDLLVTGYHSFSKKHGQFPCEDIEIRFPIPQPWIYLFRYERRFGYGSFKSQSRKPGKIKGLERITMIAQGLLSPTLMEADVGIAKYENIYKSIVWRIPRLPERNEGAYTSHLFRLFVDLGAHDEIPETFDNTCHVEFTMPCCSASQTQEIDNLIVEKEKEKTPPEPESTAGEDSD